MVDTCLDACIGGVGWRRWVEKNLRGKRRMERRNQLCIKCSMPATTPKSLTIRFYFILLSKLGQMSRQELSFQVRWRCPQSWSAWMPGHMVPQSKYTPDVDLEEGGVPRYPAGIAVYTFNKSCGDLPW